MAFWLLRSAFVVGLGLLPTLAHASDAQLWVTTALSVRLSDHWRLSNEAIARLSDDGRGLYEIENSTMVGYRIAKGVTVWAGYTHDPNYVDGRFAAMEHRGREQIVIDHLVTLGPGTFGGRLRVEQRWRDGASGTGWRVRPTLRYVVPLGHEHGPSLNLSHESFVDLNSTSFQRVRGLERMRNMIALDFPIGGKLTAELGYLNQHGFVQSGPDTSDHVASFAVNIGL